MFVIAIKNLKNVTGDFKKFSIREYLKHNFHKFPAFLKKEVTKIILDHYKLEVKEEGGGVSFNFKDMEALEVFIQEIILTQNKQSKSKTKNTNIIEVL